MTPFQQHVARWRNGCGAEICPGARKCFARGRVPADVLLIGEAPGEAENVLGKPFIGPAGKLFDRILERSVPAGVTYCLTNLTLCIPRDPDGGKAGEPADEEIRACRPRLEELIRICSPKLLVCVGKLSADWCYQRRREKDRLKIPDGLPMVDVTHPAAILRATVAQQGLLIQRCVVTIAGAVRDHVLPDGIPF